MYSVLDPVSGDISDYEEFDDIIARIEAEHDVLDDWVNIRVGLSDNSVDIAFNMETTGEQVKSYNILLDSLPLYATPLGIMVWVGQVSDMLESFSDFQMPADDGVELF